MNLRYKLLAVSLAVYCFFSSCSSVLADSEYVLPYPSFMPGNKLYRLATFLDAVKKYWYFGDFGQYSYNLSLSDKYLVEAKTLFEYKQYLLALSALSKSDTYFQRIPVTLSNALSHKKDPSDKGNELKRAAEKHIEVLRELKEKLPERFTWTPEKAKPKELSIQSSLNESIKLREEVL